jgi:NAD(P) transhydrogenase subunit alpha
VAATPETVKKLAAKHSVIVQAGAGLAASVTDEAYVAAGAQIARRPTLRCGSGAQGARTGCSGARPDQAGTVLIGMLNPFDADNNAAMAAAGLQAFALEAVPRITARSRWTCCRRRPTSPATRP